MSDPDTLDLLMSRGVIITSDSPPKMLIDLDMVIQTAELEPCEAVRAALHAAFAGTADSLGIELIMVKDDSSLDKT